MKDSAEMNTNVNTSSPYPFNEDDMKRGLDLYSELHKRLGGHPHAVKFCMGVISAAHVWDDIVDGDPVSVSSLDGIFMEILGKMVNNPWFQQHIQTLGPVMLSTILAWKDANHFEKDPSILLDESRDLKAYTMMLRSYLSQLVSVSIYLVGGEGWYQTHGPEWQRWFARDLSHHYAEFDKELRRCHQY